jgi:hypothetical protein
MVAIVSIAIVVIMFFKTPVVMIAIIVTSVANFFGIVAAGQLRPWPLSRLRVYPDIALIPVVIPVLRVILIGINLHGLRERRNNHKAFSMVVPHKAYGASANKKRGNDGDKHCLFHSTS